MHTYDGVIRSVTIQLSSKRVLWNYFIHDTNLFLSDNSTVRKGRQTLRTERISFNEINFFLSLDYFQMADQMYS